MSCISIGFNAEELVLNNRTLCEVNINEEHVIKNITTDDAELRNFLFTLGCFTGESITVISVLSESYVVSVKDARYSIDSELARAIEV